jgi:hypothetical protein
VSGLRFRGQVGAVHGPGRDGAGPEQSRRGPIVLHPPDDAVTAELVHDRDLWMVFYRPSGLTDEIDPEALRSEVGGDLAYGPIVACLEGRLRTTGRTVLSAYVETDPKHTVVAIWNLGRPTG